MMPPDLQPPENPWPFGHGVSPAAGWVGYLGTAGIPPDGGPTQLSLGQQAAICAVQPDPAV